MSLYSEYIATRGLYDIIEEDNAFITYNIKDEACYIIDIYVRPDFRHKSVGSKLANKVTDIAKEAGCKILLGSVVQEARGAEASCKALQSYGFKPVKVEPKIIWFSKEL